MDEMINVKKQAWEFFVYATLGIVPEALFNEHIEEYRTYFKQVFLFDLNDYYDYQKHMCSQKAYLDLSRTLDYKDAVKERKKEAFKRAQYGLITNNIDRRENLELCKVVKNNADASQLFNRFDFGQAQKWVNMTMKYMSLLGIVENESEIHIPIDSYILEALWDERDLKIYIPKSEKLDKNGNKYFNEDKYMHHRSDYKYSNEKVKPWSQWLVDDYILFNDNLPETYNAAWEHKNWIKISEKRKQIIND